MDCLPKEKRSARSMQGGMPCPHPCLQEAAQEGSKLPGGRRRRKEQRRQAAEEVKAAEEVRRKAARDDARAADASDLERRRLEAEKLVETCAEARCNQVDDDESFWLNLESSYETRDVHWESDEEKLFEPVEAPLVAPARDNVKKYGVMHNSARDPAKTAANNAKQNARRSAEKAAAKGEVASASTSARKVAKPAGATEGRLLGAVADFWERKKAEAGTS